MARVSLRGKTSRRKSEVLELGLAKNRDVEVRVIEEVREALFTLVNVFEAKGVITNFRLRVRRGKLEACLGGRFRKVSVTRYRLQMEHLGLVEEL